MRRRVSCVFNYCGDTIIALNSSSGMCVASSMNGFIILVSIQASSPQLPTPLHSPDLECPEVLTESHNSSWKIYMYKDSWGRLVDIHVCLSGCLVHDMFVLVLTAGHCYSHIQHWSLLRPDAGPQPIQNTLPPPLLCPAVRLKCSPSNQSARTRAVEFSNFRIDVFWLYRVIQ